MNREKNRTAIVIGAGLGGASAALSLACEGFKVEVYEKNSHIGGKLNCLKKEGFSFDLGPSILTLPHIFEKLFTLAGKKMEDYVELVEIPLQWRCFFEDGKIIDLYPREDDLKKHNALLAPQDIEDFSRFMGYSKKLYDLTERGYFQKGLDTFWDLVKFYGVFSLLRSFDALSTMDGGVSRFIHNPHLKDTLNFFVKYVGSSAYDAPALLNLLPYVQLKYGLWYVKGGMFKLAEGLTRLLKELGVTLYLDTEVVELVNVDRKITGVRLRDGNIKTGDIFISNMEVIPAYENLLHEDKKFLQNYEKFEPACSGLVLHLGVDKEYPRLGHHSFFFSNNPKEHFNSVFHKKILPDDPTLYVVAPCRTDKSQAPPGCENIKILPHIPYIQDNPFTQEDYLRLREKVLDKMERMGIKDLRKHIIVEDLWTPDDIQKRYYSNRGAIYGVVSDKKKNFALKAPKASKKYENLFFVGGSVNPGGGMPMVVLSGQQVRDMIVKKYGAQS